MTPTATRLTTPNVTNAAAGGQEKRAADGSDIEGDNKRSVIEIDGIREVV